MAERYSLTNDHVETLAYRFPFLNNYTGGIDLASIAVKDVINSGGNAELRAKARANKLLRFQNRGDKALDGAAQLLNQLNATVLTNLSGGLPTGFDSNGIATYELPGGTVSSDWKLLRKQFKNQAKYYNPIWKVVSNYNSLTRSFRYFRKNPGTEDQDLLNRAAKAKVRTSIKNALFASKYPDKWEELKQLALKKAERRIGLTYDWPTVLSGDTVRLERFRDYYNFRPMPAAPRRGPVPMVINESYFTF